MEVPWCIRSQRQGKRASGAAAAGWRWVGGGWAVVGGGLARQVQQRRLRRVEEVHHADGESEPGDIGGEVCVKVGLRGEGELGVEAEHHRDKDAWRGAGRRREAGGGGEEGEGGGWGPAVSRLG